MKLLIIIIQYIFLKRLHIALLAPVGIFYISKIVGLNFPWYIYVVGFFTIWSAYLQNITTDIKEDSYNLSSTRKYLQRKFFPIEKLYPVGFIITLIISFLNDQVKSMSILIGILLLLNAYVLPLFPYKRKNSKLRFIRLKEIFIVKNLTPSLAWAMLCVAYPIVASGYNFILEYRILFFMIFIVHLIGEINFDKPDVEGDKRCGIKTIFTMYSDRVCKGIYYFLEFLVFVLILTYISILSLQSSNIFKKALLIRAIKYLPLLIFSVLRMPFFLDLYFYSNPKQLYLDIYVGIGCLMTFLYCIISYPLNVIFIIIWHILTTVSFIFFEKKIEDVCSYIE